MRLLFYLGHPAHFHLFRRTMENLRNQGHQLVILGRRKDVLEDLLRNTGLPFQNVLPKGKSEGRLGMVRDMWKRERAIFQTALKSRPSVMVGTSVEIAHVGRLLRIPSIVVNEDDCDVVPLFARLAYPFCSCILAPECCRMGRWRAKTIFYQGYHELAYLHPNHFVPDPDVIGQFHTSKQPYFVLRFAKLTAHHDAGRNGIDLTVARQLLELLGRKGNVYITSERVLEPEFEPYRIHLDPSLIHHALAFATLYVGDSQTMAAEAAVLGTPSVRFNDFVGEIGYLNELEHRYGLTFGVKTGESEKMLRLVDEYSEPGLKASWHHRREIMLSEKLDLSAFMTWFLETFPDSVRVLKADPKYQFKFRFRRIAGIDREEFGS